MKEINSFEEWLEVSAYQKRLLLFVKTDNCSVCEGLFPQVAALQTDYSLPFYKVNIAKTPEVAGQLSLFTAPVVLLFNEGKEYTRFARFVRIDGLKKRLAELLERGNIVD